MPVGKPSKRERRTTMSDVKKDHRLEDILLYKQGLLEGEELVELEQHLPGCAECQATLETVGQFLPAMREALKPRELPAEVMLARAKAAMRAKKEKPAGFFTRMRVAFVGFALAAASAIAIALQTLLQPAAAPLMAHTGVDAGAQAHGGIVSAPHRPEPEQGPDAGVDGGVSSSGAPAGDRGGE